MGLHEFLKKRSKRPSSVTPQAIGESFVVHPDGSVSLGELSPIINAANARGTAEHYADLRRQLEFQVAEICVPHQRSIQDVGKQLSNVGGVSHKKSIPFHHQGFENVSPSWMEFGTGNKPFRYEQHLPASELKIAFVDDSVRNISLTTVGPSSDQALPLLLQQLFPEQKEAKHTHFEAVLGDNPEAYITINGSNGPHKRFRISGDHFEGRKGDVLSFDDYLLLVKGILNHNLLLPSLSLGEKPLRD